MKVIQTPIEGLLILEPQVYRDARGYFVETYNEILGENNFNPLSLPKKVAAQLYGDGGAAKSAH